MNGRKVWRVQEKGQRYIVKGLKTASFAALAALTVGCATDSGSQRLAMHSTPSEVPNSHLQFTTDRSVLEKPQEFSSNLPLGLGARFDFFVSDTASQMSDVYNDVLKPIQYGKIMRSTPLQLDYSILPSNGSAFYHDGGLDNKTIKSNYKLQIGMSRKIYSFGDLFNSNFWLAKGKFDPNAPVIYYRREDQIEMFRDMPDLHEPAEELDWDNIYGQGLDISEQP